MTPAAAQAACSALNEQRPAPRNLGECIDDFPPYKQDRTSLRHRLRAACSRSITARQPGLRFARCLTMQAVILWTLGTSWPHSRMASPVHICCASDEKAGLKPAESAVAAKAKRSAILLVRWKVIDAFPKVARGAGRYSLGALHAACAAARVIHHPGVTRCGCSISADVRIKSAAPPRCELCANAVKLQWLALTLL